MKKRLDQHLVDQGLAPSKTKAQELIESDQIEVFIKKRKVFPLKSAQQVDPNDTLVQLKPENLLKYVSRAGFKLEGALHHMKLSPKGLAYLDVGQSTGGFTDCLLQHGAKHVTGVDIADDQLAEQFRAHPKVKAHFGVHARDLKSFQPLVGQSFDGVVIDVSFISLAKILEPAVHFLKSGGYMLALLKPQFEVGSVNLDKKGVVKSKEAVTKAIQNILQQCTSLDLVDTQFFPSNMKGRDGNQEYFIYAVKK